MTWIGEQLQFALFVLFLGAIALGIMAKKFDSKGAVKNAATKGVVNWLTRLLK